MRFAKETQVGDHAFDRQGGGYTLLEIAIVLRVPEQTRLTPDQLTTMFNPEHRWIDPSEVEVGPNPGHGIALRRLGCPEGW